MNSIGDTLKSIAGDLVTNRSKSETVAEDTDTCTIRLVQDWLELEVLDEPVSVKHKNWEREPGKFDGPAKPDSCHGDFYLCHNFGQPKGKTQNDRAEKNWKH